MQKAHIHEILESLAKGEPVDLTKGVVIGYDQNGTLRLYNADMTQEELIVACEITKAKALGMATIKEMPAIVARQIASHLQRSGKTVAPSEVVGSKLENS